MDIRVIALSLLVGTSVVGAVRGLGSVESPREAESATPNASLPVERVVLFTSGVGFFERGGTISGDAVVQIDVLRSNVNDLLKSLLVSDPEGTVLSVEYASQDPLGRALKGFPIDLSDSPSVAEILSRARGASVEVRGAERTRGIVVGLEKRRDAASGGDRLVLNLMSPGGTIRSVDLTAAGSVRFLDPAIEKSIADALALIAANRSSDRKPLSLRFAGSSTRRVSVSYLVETPVWKTSYRLSAARGTPTLIQGWAIVDNPTDDDWRAVTLDLVSGEPISFRMDLESPVYATRPSIPVPLPPTIAPQTYESGIASANAKAAPPVAAPRGSAAPRPSSKSAESYRTLEGASRGGSLPLGQGVKSAAGAAEAGQFFAYSIKTPVTLLRHRSAMVPIVNREIDARQVAIYNEGVLKAHPLSGLEIKNTTGLHLMAGPITVFEEGVYAGDAEVNDLPANASRLVSYAVDLKTTATVSGSAAPEAVVSGRIERGSLVVTRRLERRRSFEFVNHGTTPRTVLVEYPFSPGWKLVEPASPAERTSSLYRFEIETSPQNGGRAALRVREERFLSQTVVLSSLDSKTILFYLGQREIGDRVKNVLSTLSRMKGELADLTTKRSTVQSGIEVIVREQERIRSNMRVLQTTSELYKRYAQTLTEQEDQLSAARKQIEELTARVNLQRKRIDDYLSSLGTLQ